MQKMQKFSLKQLVIGVFAAIALFSIILVIPYYFYEINNLRDDVYKEGAKNMQTFYHLKMNEKQNIGLTNAINIANNQAVIQALKTNDRQLAINTLSRISKQFKENTNYKNTKIHIHTKDLRSFLRVWKPNKYGDDLSGFRKSINYLKVHQKPFTTLEPGRVGLVLRGLAPIFSNGVYIGSVEFIQGLNSIVKDAREEGYEIVFVSKKSVFDHIKTFKKPQIVMNQYYLNIKSQVANKEFLNELNRFGQLKKEFKTDNFFVKSHELKDFNNQVVGYVFIGKSLKSLESTVEESSGLVNNILAVITVFALLASIFITVLINKLIVKPIVDIDKDLQYIGKNLDLTYKIRAKGSKEISEIKEAIERFLYAVKDIIQESI